MILRKKGEVSTTMVIGAIIGVLVLGIILVMLIKPTLIGKILPGIDNLFPVFGGDKPVIEQFSNFRYVIDKDDVEYYDGNTWISFKDKGNNPLEFADKSVIYNDFLKSFQDYYYQKRENKEIIVKNYKVYPISILRTSGTTLESRNRKIGDINLRILDTNTNKYYSAFLTSAGKISVDESFAISIDIPSEDAIRGEVVKWKDSIFIKPITLSYVSIKKENEQTIRNPISGYFCVTRRNSALSVDLDKIYTGGDSECK